MHTCLVLAAHTGFGRTKSLPYSDNNMRAEFLKAALEFARGGNLTDQTAVLISPSMSGWVLMPGGWFAS
jgi:hypothetical protein